MFRVSARTVLELGSELISTDIIAFYELIKNAFDAKSATGADIYFNVVLRRNDYLRLRALACQRIATELSKKAAVHHETQHLDECRQQLANALDATAGASRVQEFTKRVSGADTLSAFVESLDEAYTTLNSIEVADTGSGMSKKELTDYYLTIGTPSRKRKVNQAIIAESDRTPYLGEKGIGRLSAMRLGETLRLETARVEDTNLNVLEIDWRRFSDIDAMVDDIKLSPRTGAKKPKADWHGTQLTIGALSEDWTEKRIREFATLEFARIADPFEDPKDRARVAIHWNGTRVAIPWLDKLLIENAHAAFWGDYSIVDGKAQLKVRMEAYNLGYEHPRETDVVTLTQPDLEGLLVGQSEDIPVSALTTVGPFAFEAYWYNRRYLTGIETIGNQKEVRELLRKWSGILLFRDGFRVFPYGEDRDDWLGLDRRALGRPGYVLNKNQFVGRIQITRMGNPGLVDQTNREGLRSTPEERVLVTALQHVVRDMLWEFFRDIDRRRKHQPIELVDIGAQVETLQQRVKTAITQVRRLVPKDERQVVDEIQHVFTEFRDLSARTQRRIEEVEADSRQMLQMAGVGLMVEVVAHELARAAESALSSLESLRGKDLPAEVRAKLETLRSEMKTVSKRLRVLDQLSVSGRQRTEVFNLLEVLNDLREGHAAQFKRENIALDVRVPTAAVNVRLVKGMIVQILENLLSNSIYWTTLRASREAGFQPRIEIRVDTDPLVLYFADNGKGISPEHRDRIFRPFWSLKEKGKRRGLGLFIAQENATFLGGSLSLTDKVDDELGRHREFMLELPDKALVK